MTSGQQVNIAGPVAARHVTGRFTATAPGQRARVLRPDLPAHLRQHRRAGQLRARRGPLQDAGRSWSVTVSIGSNGSYPAAPGRNRVTIVLATPSVAATLTGYEGQPGTLRPVPALTWQTLATITITREPPSAPN